MKRKLSIVLVLSVLLGGCLGGPTPEMLAKTAQLEAQGLSKEEKRAIVLGVLMRTMPNKLDSLRIWPVRRDGFSNAISLNGSKFSQIEVEYKYTGPPKNVFETVVTLSASPDVTKMCIVLQFINGKLDKQIPAGLGQCSGDDAEDLMPLLREIEAELQTKSLANKPVPRS